MRLYYNNCNGLAATKLVKEKMIQTKMKKERNYLGRIIGDSKIEKMLATLKTWDTDIICLGETNVSWEKPIARQIFNLVKAPYSKDACWVCSSSITKSASLVKPGGTAMLVDTNITGNIADRGQDWTKMGRWSFITLRGKNDRTLHVVTGYRCNNMTSQHIGDLTAWAQQYSISRNRGVQNPKPNIDFLPDMEKWLLPLIVNGDDVILAIDANEEWTASTKIRRFASKLGLKNIALETHGSLPPTRPQSKKTIDFVLGTENVLESVKYLSMVPYDMENLGDHRGIVMDIDTNILFENESVMQNTARTRKLYTSDVKACDKYIELVKKKLGFII